MMKKSKKGRLGQCLSAMLQRTTQKRGQHLHAPHTGLQVGRFLKLYACHRATFIATAVVPWVLIPHFITVMATFSVLLSMNVTPYLRISIITFVFFSIFAVLNPFKFKYIVLVFVC